MDNMLSFEEYLAESASGNYVCVGAEDLSEFLKNSGYPEPASGTAPPDYHCTLMYSENSHIELTRILSALRASGFDSEISADVESLDMFPDSEEQGKVCLVAKLDCSKLHQAHDMLKGMGMRHSFHEYTPHVTLRYKMDAGEAIKYIEKPIVAGMKIRLKSFKSERINKDYV